MLQKRLFIGFIGSRAQAFYEQTVIALFATSIQPPEMRIMIGYRTKYSKRVSANFSKNPLVFICSEMKTGKAYGFIPKALRIPVIILRVA